MPEWSKGADLSSAIERCVGSNPTGCIFIKKKRSNMIKGQHGGKKIYIETHSCPSGLRGPSQERLSQDAWVRTPPDAFLVKRIRGICNKSKVYYGDVAHMVEHSLRM